MKILKTVALLGFVSVLSACGGPEIASRNISFVDQSPSLTFVPSKATRPQFMAQLPADLNVTDIRVNVPRQLTVSEANVYYPRADIVWRDDPIGDRYQQIKSIFETGFGRGTAHMKDGLPVILSVELVRFHSLTEKARFNVGGVHNMVFKLSFNSAVTGQPLMPTRRVEANLDAFGGGQAMVAERQGQTQKVRITSYLSQVIQAELAKPAYANQAAQRQSGISSPL